MNRRNRIDTTCEEREHSRVNTCPTLDLVNELKSLEHRIYVMLTRSRVGQVLTRECSRSSQVVSILFRRFIFLDN